MPFVSPFFSFVYCARLHLLYWIKKGRGDLILKCRCPLSEITEPAPLMCATSFSSYICTYEYPYLYMYHISICSVIDDMILTNQGWANDGELLLVLLWVTILEFWKHSQAVRTLQAPRRNLLSLIPCLLDRREVEYVSSSLILVLFWCTSVRQRRKMGKYKHKYDTGQMTTGIRQ